MWSPHRRSPADFSEYSECVQYAAVTVCTGHHEIVDIVAMCMQHSHINSIADNSPNMVFSHLLITKSLTFTTNILLVNHFSHNS